MERLTGAAFGNDEFQDAIKRNVRLVLFFIFCLLFSHSSSYDSSIFIFFFVICRTTNSIENYLLFSLFSGTRGSYISWLSYCCQ